MFVRPLLNRFHLSASVEKDMGWWPVVIKVMAVCAVVSVTNPGALKRILMQLDAPNYPSFVIHLLIWLAAGFALWTIMFEKSKGWRLLGAVLVGLSTSLSWGFRTASKIELSVFDGVALWEARHEAGNALAEYESTIAVAVILFCLVAIIMFAPVALPTSTRRPMSLVRKLTCRAMPYAVIAMIAAVMYAKAGGAYMGMPRQFSTLSIVSLAGFKEFTHPMPEHGPVTWSASQARRFDKIVLLVDESIRADYLDTQKSGATPGFASAAEHMVSFSPAVSGGICSNYANTILRYAAARSDLGAEFGANPTLFQYAKKAGFRTVYIDAQARMIGNLNGLQNFMSLAETGFIDSFYPIRQQGPTDADEELGRILQYEMSRPGAVFIYANKQGAHIPFDQNYPAAETVYRPTMSDGGRNDFQGRVNSYKNAVAHNVDHFFAAVWPKLDLANAALVYTSDHAQYLNPNGLTHCLSEGPNRRMALVPLYVFANDPVVVEQLKHGAKAASGKASHFMVAPTLLSWMGFAARDLSGKYHESLTAGTIYPPAFTTGDVFGVFKNPAVWNAMDLAPDYRANERDATPSDTRELASDEQPWLKEGSVPVAFAGVAP